MSFDGFLEQGVTITISLGPFIDKDDGDTEKTGLTVQDTDVYLSKNGGAKANPNDTNDCTEDADGIYRKQLNGTDTGTAGRLAVYCHFTDCLYVRQNYIVLDPEAYAGFVTGTAFGTDDKILVSTDAQDLSATLDVNIKTITAGIIANASFNSDVGSTAYASNIIALAVRKVLDELNLDHLMKTGVGNNADMTTEVSDGTVLSNIMTKGSDTSEFVVADDSLQAIRDILGIPANIDSGGATIADNLKKFADDNGGATFVAAGDSLAYLATTLAALGVATTLIYTDTNNIETDTQNIQSRLPNTLVSGKMDSDVGNIQDNAITLASFANTLLQALSRMAYTDISITKATGAVTAQNITAAMASAGVIQYEAIKISKTRDFVSPDTTIYRLWKYDASGDVSEVKPSANTTW